MSDEADMASDPTVVWYDPGGTSGWAVFTVHPDALSDPEVRVLDNVLYFACGQFYGDEFKQIDQMLELADQWPEAAIGTEHFVMYESSWGRLDNNLLSLVRLNAAFSYELRRHGRDRKLFRQNAALAKDAMSDERLKLCGNFYNATAGQPHARDAVRHTLTFLKRLKAKPALRLEAFAPSTE